MSLTRRSTTLLIALLCLAGCASLRPVQIVPPEISVVNLVPMSATLFEQRLRVDLRIQNPNDFNLNLAGLDFQLAVNGSELARVLSNEAVMVPHLGESIVSVAVTTTALAWMRQLRTFATTQEMNYALTGHIHLSRAGRLPFRRSGRIAPTELFGASPDPVTQ